MSGMILARHEGFYSSLPAQANSLLTPAHLSNSPLHLHSSFYEYVHLLVPWLFLGFLLECETEEAFDPDSVCSRRLLFQFLLD